MTATDMLSDFKLRMGVVIIKEIRTGTTSGGLRCNSFAVVRFLVELFSLGVVDDEISGRSGCIFLSMI